MNSTKFFALALLTAAQCAVAQINISVGKFTDESISSQGNLLLTGDQSVIADFDETSRIEAQLISETNEVVCVNFTLYKKNEIGEFVVYATPVLNLPIQEGKVSELAFGDTDGGIERFVFEVSKTV